MKFPATRLVVPVDFSDPSMQALDAAHGLTNGPSDVFILYVIDELTNLNPATLWTEDDDRLERATAALKEHAARHGLADAHVTVTRSIGNPAGAIAEYAEAVQADCIAISSNGRTGLDRFALGSVAERVVRLAKCPVLVFKKQSRRSEPPDDLP